MEDGDVADDERGDRDRDPGHGPRERTDHRESAGDGHEARPQRQPSGGRPDHSGGARRRRRRTAPADAAEARGARISATSTAATASAGARRREPPRSGRGRRSARHEPEGGEQRPREPRHRHRLDRAAQQPQRRPHGDDGSGTGVRRPSAKSSAPTATPPREPPALDAAGTRRQRARARARPAERRQEGLPPAEERRRQLPPQRRAAPEPGEHDLRRARGMDRPVGAQPTGKLQRADAAPRRGWHRPPRRSASASAAAGPLTTTRARFAARHSPRPRK